MLSCLAIFCSWACCHRAYTAQANIGLANTVAQGEAQVRNEMQGGFGGYAHRFMKLLRNGHKI